MKELLSNLIEALREELKQYGEMLALLDQQQQLVVRRQVAELPENVNCVNAQAGVIAAARQEREQRQRHLARLLALPETTGFHALIPLLPADYRPLVDALVPRKQRTARPRPATRAAESSAVEPLRRADAAVDQLDFSRRQPHHLRWQRPCSRWRRWRRSRFIRPSAEINFMLGLFGTLNLASRSLQTQMTGVEVTGQNLANVNTTGYSRQRVQISASPDVMTSIGPEGTGADATSIQQIVSSLLNSQIQSQYSTSGYWNSQQTALQSAQNGLDEFLNGSGATSSTSFRGTEHHGFRFVRPVELACSTRSAASPPRRPRATSRRPSARRSNWRRSFNNISSQLGSVNASLNSSLSNDVSSANTLLTQIATLNSQITTAQVSGGNANDLLDEREQDLENLSQLTNITTSTGTNGAVNVTIGGQTLVSGNTVNDTLQTYDPGNGNLLVQTATGGVNLTLTGGSMQGTIDARDGTLATMQNQWIHSLARI